MYRRSEASAPSAETAGDGISYLWSNILVSVTRGYLAKRLISLAVCNAIVVYCICSVFTISTSSVNNGEEP